MTEKRETIKLYIGMISIFLILLCVFIFLLYLTIPKGIKHPQYSVGTIVGFSNGSKSGGSVADFEFFVHGKKYMAHYDCLSYAFNVIGEKFKIVYEKNDPTIREVISYYPIIAKEELNQFITTEGKIVSLGRTFSLSVAYNAKYNILFTYFVNGNKYYRIMNLPKNYKKKYPHFNEGNAYKVKYWALNPNRAIIYLNEPIRK